MRRLTAASLAASLLISSVHPAACAAAQAAGPFQEVPLATPRAPSYRWAYASLLAGASLVGVSFAITDRANQSYADYLRATDPGEVRRLYDEAERYDHLSAAALLTGEALVATGVYLRFLHRPTPKRLSLTLDPGRCAVSLRF